jgi:TonB family protein
VRSTIGVFFLTLALGLSASEALAEPCPVYLRYLVKTAAPHTYAVGFASYANSSAEIALMLYGGDDVYVAHVPGVAFTRPLTTLMSGFHSEWLSDAAYVRLPADAAPLEFAKLDIQSPETHSLTGCTSEIRDVAWLGPPAKAPNDAFAAEYAKDIAQAEAGYSLDSPAAEATVLPREPKLVCAHPLVDAKTLHVFQPAYPEIARREAHIGFVQVAVELDASGNVASTRVYRSSGWDELDAATRDAAARTTYSPEIFRCQPIASQYIFRSDFVPH